MKTVSKKTADRKGGLLGQVDRLAVAVCVNKADDKILVRIGFEISVTMNGTATKMTVNAPNKVNVNGSVTTLAVNDRLASRIFHSRLAVADIDRFDRGFIPNHHIGGCVDGQCAACMSPTGKSSSCRTARQSAAST